MIAMIFERENRLEKYSEMNKDWFYLLDIITISPHLESSLEEEELKKKKRRVLGRNLEKAGISIDLEMGPRTWLK